MPPEGRPMKAHTPIRHRMLASMLCTAILNSLLPLAASGADATGATGAATPGSNILDSITGALQSTNTFVNAFGVSSAQLGGLATQLVALQNQAAGIGAQQTALAQIQTSLQSALAQAQMCMNGNGSTPSTLSKFKKAGKIAANQLGSAVVNCSTYGAVMDAIGKENAQMQDSRRKMACLQNLQNNVNTIAERAKVPFQALTSAAQEVWQTYDQIITIHKNISEKIKNQVDGDNGYRKKLGDLKKLSIQLNSVLNGAPGAPKDGQDGGSGMPTGLAKAVDDLKVARAKTANDGYRSLMQDTQYCFANDSTKECFTGAAMSPQQCMVAYVSNGSMGDSSTGAINGQNFQRLQQTFIMTYGKINQGDLPASLDAKNADQLLSFLQSRFNTMLSTSQQQLLNTNFIGKIDKQALSAFMAQKYNDCYNTAVAVFKADLSSGVGPYSSAAKALSDQETQTANNIKTTIDLVESQMTDFRTQFHQVYNSDLPQFTGDCTASDNPYESLDCLRVLKVTLASGIKGTAQSIKLSNGNTTTIDSGVTNLSVQTLSNDASGKPVTSSGTVQCKGFDDCINFLDRSKSSHDDAVNSQTLERDKFVQNNNKALAATMDTVSGQFSQITAMISQGVNALNLDLVNMGIHGTLKTKTADGEQLEQDDTTKLYKMPKSMKAAFSGRNSYQEIDDQSTSDVVNSYNDMVQTMNQKSTEAAKMKAKCRITKPEYDALAGLMPADCGNTKVVCTDKSQAAMSQMDAIFRKSELTPPDDFSSISSTVSSYNSCKSEIVNQAVSDFQAAAPAPSTVSNGTGGTDQYAQMLRDRNQAQAEVKSKAYAEGRAQCSDALMGPLLTDAGQGRSGDLVQQNTGLVNSYKAILDACSAQSPPDEEAVAAACNGFKKAAKNAQPPAGEDESKADGSTSSTPVLVNPLTPGAINAN
jgi:hypothetical protein